MPAKNMYKVTRGSKEYKMDTYAEAVKKFNLIKRWKTPPNVFTRLYCNLGDGYKLMQAHSNRLLRV